MIPTVKNILFATNLKPECLEAFHYAVALATRFEATLVMVHVMEKVPDYVEKRLISLLGKEEWESKFEAKVDGARQQLIGKRNSNTLIQEALAHFCSNVGISDDSCGYRSNEIVVTEGDDAESIVQIAEEYNCDIIVMGMKAGLISHHAIGSVAKSVMRKSDVPVMVVPPKKEAKN